MLENMRDKRQSKRIEALQKRIERLSAANEALKDEKLELEQELIVCRAKLDKTGQYERELKQVLAEAREAKAAYDAAHRDLQLMRKQYAEQVKALIRDIKGNTD